MHGYAQENPDLDEQPERAPAGMDGLFDVLWIEADILFCTFGPPHFLHLTSSVAEDDKVMVSNISLQSLHSNS